MSDLEHYAFLESALPRLSARQRTLFALGCAEHVRFYLADEAEPSDAARAALDAMWAALDSAVLDLDAFESERETISELCDNDDDALEEDLLQPLSAVDYAFDTLTEPNELQGPLYASSSGIATAHYADWDDADGKDLEIQWQRELLRRIISHGGAPATRDTFCDLFDVPPTWLPYTPRG